MWFVDYEVSFGYRQAYFPTEDLARHFKWWLQDTYCKPARRAYSIDIYYADVDEKNLSLSSFEEENIVKFLKCEKEMQAKIAKINEAKKAETKKRWKM